MSVLLLFDFKTFECFFKNIIALQEKKSIRMKRQRCVK